MKLITKNATTYTTDGFRDCENVEIYDHGDTVSIGATEHNKTDLHIYEDNIWSPHGWYVEWPTLG